MPEAYTHIRIARAAQQRAAQPVPSQNAFEMGAQGPDPLFAYKVLSRHKPFDLAGLGDRMHEEQCGAFLRSLVFRAFTPAQRSYVMGFLTHYAADATLHPYVAAQTAPGGVFARPYGHGFCEVAMDSWFHQTDQGSPAVPADTAAPPLYTAQLAEVTELLHACILEVYGQDITREALADAFHDFRWLHGLFCSPRGGRRALVTLAETLVLHKPGWGRSHMTPAKLPRDGFPARWHDPYTDQDREEDPAQLADRAANLAAEYLREASGYWQGLGSKERLAQKLGDRSYTTGLLSRPAPEEDAREA